jgi:MOB kinase activator 1
LNWVRDQIEDESLMPVNVGVGFNKKFESTVKTIFKKISRVYGHLYFSHYTVFSDYKVVQVLNTSFKHFVFFVQEFDLVSKKDLLPLENLIQNIENR